MPWVNTKFLNGRGAVYPASGGDYFARFLMYLLRYRKVNRVFERLSRKQGLEFIDALVAALHFRTEAAIAEVQRIPDTGPAVLVSNHPLGGLEGLLLVRLLSGKRRDVKIIASQLFQRVDPVSDFFLEPNPFVGRPTDSGYSGLKMAVKHIRDGGILCLFPAGETGTYDLSNVLRDKIWRIDVLRFIKKLEVPVVPVLFQTGNLSSSNIFSLLNSPLNQLRMSSRFIPRAARTIHIRIGNPIKPDDQKKFSDVQQFGRYLRAKTYGMETHIQVKRFFNYSLRRARRPVPVIEPISSELIQKEIDTISTQYLLFRLREYNVFCVPTAIIPNILYEIGRLREITFREVGEGTNLSIDIDEFDLYYHQMFIWDETQKKIVGAYRLGIGYEIMQQFGKGGFYLHSLFKLSDRLSGFLSQSLELGRSFVIKEYQRKPMPLFLLWKGILYFMLKHPEFRYLIGPVSISNNYSTISKDLIIQFIMANHFDWNIARQVKPRNSYQFRAENPDLKILMESMEGDINNLDRVIGDVDALNAGLPVLLKKYIKLNARIAGFNVDPGFNNSLDGLIVLDIYDVPKNTIESLLKEVNDGSLLERFYSSRELHENVDIL